MFRIMFDDDVMMMMKPSCLTRETFPQAQEIRL
jgi:hypothetical protein